MKKKAERPRAAGKGGSYGDVQDLLRTAWETSKSLFDYRKADEAMRLVVPHASIRNAVIVFVAAAAILAVLSLVIYAESIYFAAFTFKVLAETLGSPAAEPDFGALGPFALFVIISAPLGLLAASIQDGLIYYALRFTGGRGTFTQQYYLSSFVALAMTMSSAILLLTVVPCIGALALLVQYLLMFYLTFVVRCRAYAAIHGLSYGHVLVMVFLSCLPLIAAIFMVSGALADTLHIQQAAIYNITNLTNATGA